MAKLPYNTMNGRKSIVWTISLIGIILGGVAALNTGFYQLYAGDINETKDATQQQEVRLRTVEQSVAATVVELRTIRESLARIEKYQVRRPLDPGD